MHLIRISANGLQIGNRFNVAYLLLVFSLIKFFILCYQNKKQIKKIYIKELLQ